MQTIVVTDDDVRYFQEKYERALARSGPEAAEKYRKQLEAIKDAIVIYHETRTGSN